MLHEIKNFMQLWVFYFGFGELSCATSEPAFLNNKPAGMRDRDKIRDRSAAGFIVGITTPTESQCIDRTILL